MQLGMEKLSLISERNLRLIWDRQVHERLDFDSKFAARIHNLAYTELKQSTLSAQQTRLAWILIKTEI
jgi:hypothetical protein